MKILGNELHIEQEFDSFCRTILRNSARDIYRSEKNRNNKTISIEVLPERMLEQLTYADIYAPDRMYFSVYGFDIPVDDIEIAQAIKTLPQRQKEVILLSFFLGMQDVEIAKLFDVKPETIFVHKDRALKKLKSYMEAQNNED